MSNKSVLLQVSLVNGLITGIIFSVINVLAYLLDLSIMWFILVILVQIIIIVFAMILTIKKVREKVEGQGLNYGSRFLSGLIVGVIAGWVSGLFSYLLFQVIDTNHLLSLAEGFAETLMDFGLPEEDAYKAVDDMKEGFQPIEQIKSDFLKMPAFYVVVSLIVSAFIKNKKAEDIVTN